jgi:hypothetical protein
MKNNKDTSYDSVALYTPRLEYLPSSMTGENVNVSHSRRQPNLLGVAGRECLEEKMLKNHILMAVR